MRENLYVRFDERGAETGAMAEPVRNPRRKRWEQICSAYSHRATPLLYAVVLLERTCLRVVRWRGQDQCRLREPLELTGDESVGRKVHDARASEPAIGTHRLDRRFRRCLPERGRKRGDFDGLFVLLQVSIDDRRSVPEAPTSSGLPKPR